MNRVHLFLDPENSEIALECETLIAALEQVTKSPALGAIDAELISNGQLLAKSTRLGWVVTVAGIRRIAQDADARSVGRLP